MILLKRPLALNVTPDRTVWSIRIRIYRHPRARLALRQGPGACLVAGGPGVLVSSCACSAMTFVAQLRPLPEGARGQIGHRRSIYARHCPSPYCFRRFYSSWLRGVSMSVAQLSSSTQPIQMSGSTAEKIGLKSIYRCQQQHGAGLFDQRAILMSPMDAFAYPSHSSTDVLPKLAGPVRSIWEIHLRHRILSGSGSQFDH
ncbi:MAG: hypothetical protein CM15mP120_10700 [Pseudomonadota bacterium]|nr:MAG: hypothetical protein CM15mP120_10700 [Pseudomonadota bacterium]